jgi:uncharacterized coiled-coil DUF342 family protein
MANRIVRQGPTQPDPLEELRDEVDSMRNELAAFQTEVAAEHKWIKSALKEILQNLEMKSDRD